jgi:hypothetical protein
LRPDGQGCPSGLKLSVELFADAGAFRPTKETIFSTDRGLTKPHSEHNATPAPRRIGTADRSGPP